MLSSDLDDTLTGNRDALARFNQVWITQLVPFGCKLVYNTGRSLEDYLAASRDWDLLKPDAFIGGCGEFNRACLQGFGEAEA